MRLPEVTIRLDAVADLRAADYEAGVVTEPDAFVLAYREAAEAICDGYADVRIEEVTGGDRVGCDAEWAQEFGLWQAVHDCVGLDGGGIATGCDRVEWSPREQRVAETRRNLRVWMSRRMSAAAE